MFIVNRVYKYFICSKKKIIHISCTNIIGLINYLIKKKIKTTTKLLISTKSIAIQLKIVKNRQQNNQIVILLSRNIFLFKTL